MKILVVDDEKLLVKGIKFNLENDGYEVVTGGERNAGSDRARSDDAPARRAGSLHENPGVFAGPNYYVNRKVRGYGQAAGL